MSKITIRDIQETVARFYGLPVLEMRSGRRDRSIARPRQVAMYLSRRFTTQTLPAIGERFGNKDHSTVIHALHKINELKQEDEAIREDLFLLERDFAARNLKTTDARNHKLIAASYLDLAQ
jgi:chromosomal replication initiator protein